RHGRGGQVRGPDRRRRRPAAEPARVPESGQPESHHEGRPARQAHPVTRAAAPVLKSPSGGCADRYALIVFAPRDLTATFSDASEAISWAPTKIRSWTSSPARP